MFDYIGRIFSENKDKRICVIGTTCTGKSTIIRETQCGSDMDEEIFPLLTEEEEQYVCQTPWTEEIGAKMDELVKTKLKIKPGCPMFGTVLLDCDLIVYLHISDDLLHERCMLRGVDYMNAKNMQQKIEDDIYNSAIEHIVVEVENFIKTK
jgi:hypothetical protein